MLNRLGMSKLVKIWFLNYLRTVPFLPWGISITGASIGIGFGSDGVGDITNKN